MPATALSAAGAAADLAAAPVAPGRGSCCAWRGAAAVRPARKREREERREKREERKRRGNLREMDLGLILGMMKMKRDGEIFIS